MAFKLNKADLEFVLKQIKIGEAHSNGTPLTEIRLDAAGEVITDRAWYTGPSFDASFALAIPDPKTPYGVRTVDGSYNNLVEGREMWGAAGQGMPRMLDGGAYLNENDGDANMFGTPANPVWLTNNDYTPGAPTGSPMLAPGTVADADPRIISNLIGDMSPNNPAAIIAALTFGGDEDAYGTLAGIQAAAAASDDSPGWSAGLKVLLNPLSTAAQKTQAQAEVNAVLEEFGIEVDATGSLLIPNVAPDEGLSAPFNSWMTFFGQFFDHGLDLISKGGAGTIYIPLAEDDPLYNPETPHTNFMVLTRSTNVTGPDGELTQRNVTTSWVDQNQTYTSHPSHQVFLREYVKVDGQVFANGRLLDGINAIDGSKNGLASWRDVKDQAKEMLGILLDDRDVGSVPLVRTDAYGEFVRDPVTGYAQLIVGVGADGIPNTADDVTVSGTPADPVNPTAVGAIRTPNAFLDDIAHNVAPVVGDHDNDPATPNQLMPDSDSVVGYSGGVNSRGGNTHYDNELLNRHFVTGDGRGNENIGLTAVHTVFHAEHNRQVESQKRTIVESGDLAFLNEWLRVDVSAIPTTSDGIAALQWDGERLFQAGRMATEMQYQHLVFEEFGRKIQPAIDPFVFNSVTDIDPSIFSEFANVVYRFGHSMLTDSMPRVFLDGSGKVSRQDDMGLIASFLNPVVFNDNGSARSVDNPETRENEGNNPYIYAEAAAGAIIRGMTTERGNEIDEFLTGALRNNLLGIPLDLAAINIARGRDTNMPTLNEAREQLYAATGSTFLTPYDSWAEFAANLKNPMSVVNFIAAYGKHSLLEGADTVAEKRDAAMALVGLTSATATEAAAVANASFEANSLADGQPGVISDPKGNYTTSAPDGWTMTGTGGVYAPTAGIVSQSGVEGSNVAWLSTDALLSKVVGELEAGAKYRLSVDVGDRTDLGWPGGEARLVASDGTVLASVALPAPADGDWTTVTFETGAVAAGLAGLELRIEIEQAGGNNQILVDDVRLDVVRPVVLTDRLDFLNSTGSWNAASNGLNDIDLWIGGLAEKKMPFGGMLGSTFNAVFEAQMEALQDGDRFYYLTRTQGQNFLNALEENSFAKIMMANTDISRVGPDGIRGTDDDIVTRHIGVDSFATYDYVFEVSAANQADYNGAAAGVDPAGADPVLEALGMGKVIRNNPQTAGPDVNYFRTFGGEHVVVGGTSANDTIITDFGDDGIWGDGGNDRIESGAGVDLVNGGPGNDIITDSGDTGDFLKGDSGNDVIANSNGLDVLMGGTGKDAFFVGVDDTEVFGGEGDDFILGGVGADLLMGNEGDDWIEGGDGFDSTAGDNSELFFNSKILGHDVLFAGSEEHDFDAESGDDVMVQGESIMRNEGMWGFDWSTYKGSNIAADADLTVRIFTTEEENTLRNRFDQVEGLSGWDRNDVLRGDSRTNAPDPDADPADPPSADLPETRMDNNELSHAGLARVSGLGAVLGDWVNGVNNSDLEKSIAFEGGNVILGGGGSDVIEGRGGNDVLDGDKWLNVRIRITGEGQANTAANQIATIDSIKHKFADDFSIAAWRGKTVFELMLDRTITPSQLHIVREVVKDDGLGDTDVAVYWDVAENYTFTRGADGSYIVSHTGFNEGDVPDGTAVVSDGEDKLWNIEKLRFGDGNGGTIDYDIGTFFNSPATGAPTINDQTPTEGQTLTASTAGIADLDGIASAFSYQWQTSADGGTTWTNVYDNLQQTSDATFVPNNGVLGFGGQIGNLLRVGVSFTDGQGKVETLYSTQTGVVGDSWTRGLLTGDTFNGTAGNDIAAGGNGVFGLGATDNLNGNAGDDSLSGNGGNDNLNGGAGNDTLNGGSGTDVAIFAGPVTNFNVEIGSGENMTVTDLTGAEGTDTVTLVETLRFNGVNYTVTLGSNTAGQTTTTNGGSQALFGRGGNDTLNAGNGNDILSGGIGNDTLNGGNDADLLNGGAGNDTVRGDAGDDRLLQSSTEGRDFLDGGAGTDTFHLIGSAVAENFVVYTRAAAIAAGVPAASLNVNTEIVVTRQVGTGPAAVISELDNIEEIEITTTNPGGPTSPLGAAPVTTGAGDTIAIVGSFTGTSLSYNTITVAGSTANDKVDISGLKSDHRLVFNGGGGSDAVAGATRPQDVIDLAAGAAAGAPGANSMPAADAGWLWEDAPGAGAVMFEPGLPIDFGGDLYERAALQNAYHYKFPEGQVAMF